MPKIFTNIDLLMKARLNRRRTSEVVSGMPPGQFEFSEKWVESQPIIIPGLSRSCFFRGKFDVVAALDGGAYAVVDFKTASRRDDHIPLYSRQLHCYAYALENAGIGKFALQPVTTLGLLVFEPDAFSDEAGAAMVQGKLTWINIPRDDRMFMEFLADVLAVLELPTPAPSPECGWCRYSLTGKPA